MKLAILTFFDSDNYGAVLQAYALQDYLESLGHTVTLIRLKRNITAVSSHFKQGLRVYTLRQRIWNRIVMARTAKLTEQKRIGFQKFRDDYLNITSVCYDSGEVFLKDASQYDLFISGGDQIWNPYHKVFSLDYMMAFLPESYRRISYASSFGVERIEDAALLKLMGDALKKYEAISVRESSGVEIVWQMGIQAMQVLDPVFLNVERWKSFVREERPIKDKYGLVYALIDYTDECDKKIRQHAKDAHLKTVILPENRRNCMNRYQKAFGLSPIEFINYIAHSDIVYTNSFHGLAFAIIFHKQVVLLEPVSAEARSKQNRLLNLLKVLNMVKCNFESIACPIDYDSVYGILDGLIEESKNYLLHSIEEK